jgi:hypothetical protein
LKLMHIQTITAGLIVIGAVLLFGDPRINAQPYTNGIALLLAGLLLWATANGWRVFRRRPAGIAWKASIRTVSRVGLAASLIVTLFLLMADLPPDTSVPWSDKTRVISLIVPLALAIQAALIFSPDDEPSMEILLACPRPVAWVLLERIGVAALAQTGIVLVSIALIPHKGVLPLLTDWLPPAFLLTGVGVYITIRSHTAAFGVIVAGLLWFTAVFLGNALLPGSPTLPPFDYIQPVLWLLHPYLEPGILADGDYWLNRLCVTALGINLIALAAHLLRDEERIITGAQKTAGI